MHSATLNEGGAEMQGSSYFRHQANTCMRLFAGQIGATLRLFAAQSYCGICCEFNRNQTDVYETKEI